MAIADIFIRIVTKGSELAKRQMTWLKSWQNVTWLQSDDKENLHHILSSLS